eukprot:363966-Chlamydomonas_euryale.AAC.6
MESAGAGQGCTRRRNASYSSPPFPTHPMVWSKCSWTIWNRDANAPATQNQTAAMIADILNRPREDKHCEAVTVHPESFSRFSLVLQHFCRSSHRLSAIPHPTAHTAHTATYTTPTPSNVTAIQCFSTATYHADTCDSKATQNI